MKDTQTAGKSEEKISDYCALQVANELLLSIPNKYHDIDVLKLNRLLFLAYGLGKLELKREIFIDRIEAWKYGPIIPSVYHYFSHFHLRPIIAQAFEYDFFDNKFREYRIHSSDTILLSFIQDVYARFGNDNKFSLIHHIWSEDSPWAQIYQGQDFVEIKKDLIEKYFENFVSR